MGFNNLSWQDPASSKTRFLRYIAAILFLFLVLSSTGFSAGISITTDGIAKSGGQVSISLGALGNEDGIHFVNAAIGHEEKLVYSVPHDTAIASAGIHLRYETSPLLDQRSNILLLVNGHPLKQVRLMDEQYRRELKVDIPVNLIQPGALNITLKVTLLTANNRYLDSRAHGALLHIEADSTLTVGYQGDIASLRDAWVLLPEKVILTVPDRPFSEDEFTAVWGIMDHLYRQGKKIAITHFPEVGHIVIGDRSSLKKRLLLERRSAQSSEQELPGSLETLDNDSTIMLLNSPLRSVISIARPVEISASALMNDTWRKLVAGNQYNLFTTGVSEKHNRADDGVYEIRLADFGMDTSVRSVWANTEWRLLLDPFKMPAGTRPTMLFLDLIVPPPSDKAAFSLYTYLNDIMIHAQHLDSSGDVQRFQIPLPAGYQQLYNNLRIQIMNAEVVHGFAQEVTTFPVQLLPESVLILEQNTAKPERFVDLPAYLADHFDFYLPSAYLDKPDQSLLFVAAFTANFPVPFAERKAVFVRPDSTFTPTRPFIALGDVSFSELDASVSFDQGVIEIRDRKGSSLLTVDELSEIAVAQLVTSHGQHGLWLRSGDGDPYPDVRRLFLNEDDVAFADRNGLLFSLNSAEPSLARVHYPSVRSWLASVSEYRFWIMVFVWLILTLVIAYLFRRRRQQQSNSQ